MKPVHEITWKEWIDLPVSEKTKYPSIFCNSNWNGYYIVTLLIHILIGEKIAKKIWKALPDDYKTYLIENYLKNKKEPINNNKPFLGGHFPYPPIY